MNILPYRISFLKALKRRLAERFSKVRSHLQYLRFDPSKPSKTEFLKLETLEQEAWIEEVEPDYGERLYGEGFLGSSYQLDPSTLDERLQYREDYGVGGMIASQMSGIGDERQDEIEGGATLNDDELEALHYAIAEEDYHGWDIHSGCYIKLRLGAVFALYEGEDLGQGGASFELERVFASKRKALTYLSLKPFIAMDKSY